MALTATAGNVTVSDNLDGTDTTKGLVKADAGKVEISANAETASVTVKEDATVEAGKNVAITAGKDVFVRDTADVLAGNKGTASEAVRLDAVNGTVSVDGTVVATEDDVVIEAAGAVLVSDKAATEPLNGDGVSGLVQAKAGNVSIESETAGVTVQDGAKVLAGVNDDADYTVAEASKTVTVTAAQTSGTGSVTVRDNAVVAGSQDVTANAQDAVDVLGNAQVLAKAGNVSIESETAGVTVSGSSSVTADQNVSIVAGNGVSVDGTGSAVTAQNGNLDITANGTDGIQAEGKLEATEGVTTLSATEGVIDAQNSNNDFKSVTATAKGGVTLSDKDDITLTEVTATEGDVRVKAGTSLTVADADAVKVSGQNIRLEATAGAITVGAGVNGKNVTLMAGTTVTTKMENGISNGELSAAKGDLYIDAGGDVTLGAAQTATADTDTSVEDKGGVMAVKSGGAITATGATTAGTLYTKDENGVSFSSVSADKMSAISGSDIKFTFTKDVEVAYKSTGGKIEVESTGNVTVKSATRADEDLVVTEVTWPTGTQDVKLIDKTNLDTQINGIDAAKEVVVKSTGGNVIVETQVVGGTAVKIDAKNDVEVKGDATVTAKGGDVIVGTDKDHGIGGSFTAQNGATVEATAGNVKVYASGDVKINGAATSMTATGGDVVLDAGKGVEVVSAKVESIDKSVDIDAKTGVKLVENATVKASKDVTVDNSTSGKIVIGTDGETGDETSVSATAGSVAVNNAAADVSVLGGAKVTAKTDVEIDAKGSVLVDDSAAVKADAIALTAKGGDVTVDGAAGVTAGKGVTLTASKGVDVLGDATVTANGGDSVLTAQGEDVKVTGDVKASANATVSANTAVEVSDNGTITASEGDVAITAKNAVTVSGTAAVEAEKSVTVKSTDAGDITVDTTGTVTAKDGNVTIDNDNGAVTIQNATVEAKGDAGNVAIEATTGVTIAKGSQDATVTAANDVTVDNSTSGNIVIGTDGEPGDGTSVSAVAGKVAVNNAAADVSVLGGAKVTANGGDAVLTAQGDVKVTGDVKASANATLSANTAVEVSEDGTVKATAGDVAITAKNAVTVTGTSAVEAGAAVTVKSTDAGDITIDTTGTVTAKGGNVTIDNADGAVTIQNGTVTADKHVLVETSGGDITVKEAAVAAGDNLRLGSAGNVKVDTGVTMSAAGNATIEATGNVTLNSHVTTTGKQKTMEILAGNTVSMGNGVTVSTQNGNIAVVAEKGDIDIASLNAGEGNVWLEAGGTIKTKNGDGETGISAAGAAMSSSKIGTEEDPLKLNLETMALSATDGVYVENGRSTTIVSASQNTGNGSFNVNHVEKDGSVTLNTPGAESASGGSSADINGVISTEGDVVLTNHGNVTIADGAQVQSVTKDVTITADNGGSITQANTPSISVDNGMAESQTLTATIIAKNGTVKLNADGDIGGSVSASSISPVVVDAKKGVEATGKNVTIAAANGDNLTLTGAGVKASADASVYTAGNIKADGSAGIAGQNVTVTAHDFSEGAVNVNVGNKLTVNNIFGGYNPMIAIFKNSGGSDNPKLSNLPNGVLAFLDGRLLGGDIQWINKLGALEAFPVQTPELKSEQGVFGNPFFMHGNMDMSEPVALGIIDFLLVDPAAIQYGPEFPLFADTQVDAAGLSPEFSYRFLGKKQAEQQTPEASPDNEKVDDEKDKSE